MATRTGYAYGRPDTTPAAGFVQAPPSAEDYGSFGDFYMTWFETLLGQLVERAIFGVETILVNYEAPILPEKRWDKEKGKMVGGTSLATTRKLHFMGPALETVCKRINKARPGMVDCRECNVSTVKKELVGNGHADKSAMVLAARAAGIPLPPGDAAFDVADAFGIFVLAVRLHGTREEAAAWDRRIHGRTAPQERLSAEQARKLFGKR